MLCRIRNSSLIFGLPLATLLGFITFNQALSVQDTDPPIIHVQLLRRGVEGFRWTPNGEVQIEVYDSPGGTLLAGPVNVQANIDGEFNASNISLFIPGMFVRATDQTTNVIKELTIQNIQITSIDAQNDLVNGIAPPNVFVSALIEEPPGNWNWGIGSFSDGVGMFSVSFSGILDIQPDHKASALYNDEDGDDVETSPEQNDIFHLQGGYDHDWMEFYYYSPANMITYQVLDEQGNLLSSGQTPTNAQGWGYINFDDHGVDFQPGYQIVGIDYRTNLSDTITLQDISTTEADYDLNYIAGTAPPDTDLKIMVGTEGGGAGSIYHFDIHSDVGGNWSSYIFDEFGYDLVYDTWVYAELSDENSNTTFAALDEDADEIINGIDNARLIFNPDQSDLDIDEVGDVEDPCPNNLENSCNANRSGAISINQLGGVLSTSEGDTTMIVPAGSLSKDTSISITDTGEGYPWSYQTFSGGSNPPEMWAIFSNFIGPSTITITVPISITLSWDDANDDGYVDDLNIAETNLLIYLNNVPLSSQCRFSANCDPENNRFTFTTSVLGDFALVGEKANFAVFLPSVIR